MRLYEIGLENVRHQKRFLAAKEKMCTFAAAEHSRPPQCIMLPHDDILRERLLIAGLREDSRQAFDIIYRSYAGRLLAYCTTYTKNAEVAKEIVQEAFIKLWDMRRTVRPDQGLGALLFTMVRHRIIDEFRRLLSRGIYDDYLRYVDCIESDDTSASAVEYGEFVAKVRKALSSLPSTQRRAIEMCRLEGLSAKEAAAKLSLSEQTVKNSLSLGLKTLHKLLTQ